MTGCAKIQNQTPVTLAWPSYDAASGVGVSERSYLDHAKQADLDFTAAALFLMLLVVSNSP